MNGRKDFIAGAELGSELAAHLAKLSELQGMVNAIAPDALRVLLRAVADGATFEMQGPRAGADVPIRAWLDHREEHCQAGGQTGEAVLLELATEWNRLKGQSPKLQIDGWKPGAFAPALPPNTLRMWRVAFEQLHASPALASAGTALVAELERAYEALEQRK